MRVETALPERVPSSCVRLKYLYCGICGSDVSYYEGYRPIKEPISLGHEFVAQVIEVGSMVSEFSEGDYVVSDLNYRCTKCEYCNSNRSHLCIENTASLFSNRAFAKYGDIDHSYLAKVQNAHDMKIYTLVEPLSCIIHGVSLVRAYFSESALIMGCGNLGLCLAFYLKSVLQTPKIYVYDHNQARIKALCAALEVLPYNGENCDIVFDVTGTIDGLSSAINAASFCRRVCSFSHLYGFGGREMVYDTLCRQEIQVHLPLRNGERKNLDQAAWLITEQWKHNLTADLFDLFPIENIDEAFTRKNKINKCKYVIHCN